MYCLPVAEAGLNQSLETRSQSIISTWPMVGFWLRLPVRPGVDMHCLCNSCSVKISVNSSACGTSLGSKTSFSIVLLVAGWFIGPEQPTELQTSIKWQPLDHLLYTFEAARFQKEESGLAWLGRKKGFRCALLIHVGGCWWVPGKQATISYYSLVCKLWFLCWFYPFLQDESSKMMILIKELTFLCGKWCEFPSLPRVCSMLELLWWVLVSCYRCLSCSCPFLYRGTETPHWHVKKLFTEGLGLPMLIREQFSFWEFNTPVSFPAGTPVM